MVYDRMLARGKQGYTLPAPRPRDAPLPKPQIGPKSTAPDTFAEPILGSRLKRDWDGKTREQLLALEDSMFTAEMIACPRAFVVPPPPKTSALKRDSYLDHVQARDQGIPSPSRGRGRNGGASFGRGHTPQFGRGQAGRGQSSFGQVGTDVPPMKMPPPPPQSLHRAVPALPQGYTAIATTYNHMNNHVSVEYGPAAEYGLTPPAPSTGVFKRSSDMSV